MLKDEELSKVSGGIHSKYANYTIRKAKDSKEKYMVSTQKCPCCSDRLDPDDGLYACKCCEILWKL